MNDDDENVADIMMNIVFLPCSIDLIGAFPHFHTLFIFTRLKKRERKFLDWSVRRGISIFFVMKILPQTK